MQTKHTRSIVTLVVLCSALLIQGCGQEIDAKQATSINGLIYKLNDNEPFTGKVSNFMVNLSMDILTVRLTGKCDVSVKKGVLDGTTTCTAFEKPTKVFEADYSKGKLDGTEKHWDWGNGELASQASWKEGRKDGTEEGFNPANGKKVMLIHWSNGSKVGDEKRWSSSGDAVLTDLQWKNGKASGYIKTTGNVSFGDEGITQEATYKDGVLDGVKKTYDIDRAKSTGVGQKGAVLKYHLSSQENYVNGKLDGLQQKFGVNGDVYEESKYSNDIISELTQYAVVNGKRSPVLHKVNLEPAKDPRYNQFAFVKDGKEICLDESGNVVCDIDWAKGKPLKGFIQMKIAGERKSLLASFSGVPNASGTGLVKDGVEKRVDEKSGQPDSDITWSKGVAISTTDYVMTGGKLQANQLPIANPKQDDPEGQFPTQSW